jgi:hypothetical protein
MTNRHRMFHEKRRLLYRHSLTLVFIFSTILLCSPLSFAEQKSVIVRYSGEKAGETLPFTTSGPWVILYTAEGPINIVIRKKDGTFNRTAIQNLQAGSKGSALQKNAGTYYLDVDAYRPWHIQVRHMN